MGIASARNAPRSTATPRWGWSGVEVLSTPLLPDDQLTQIVGLLPIKLLTREEIKTKILDLGARYHRYLHQDEFGPTRAERMSALRRVLGQLEQLDSLILKLPQHLALDLTSNSKQPSFRILHNGSVLRGWTVAQIHQAASVKLSEGDAQYSADDRDLLKEICTTAGAATELIQSLDTSSESELFVDAVCAGLLIGKDAQGTDVFCIGGAPIDRLKSQLRITVDRLQHRRGPEKQLSVPWLVWELCELWTRATGQPVTNSAVRNGRYTSRPESLAGKFVLAIVEALQPSESWTTHNLRAHTAVRAQKFDASPEVRGRTVSIALRAYVARHQRPSARRRGRPRA